MWQVYEKTCTCYLEFFKNYLHFSRCIYFNQRTKAKGWQLVLLRNLLHALSIRNSQGVEEALVVPERSEQNTKLPSSRHQGEGEKNGQHSLSKWWLRGMYQSLTIAILISMHLFPELFILGGDSTPFEELDSSPWE